MASDKVPASLTLYGQLAQHRSVEVPGVGDKPGRTRHSLRIDTAQGVYWVSAWDDEAMKPHFPRGVEDAVGTSVSLPVSASAVAKDGQKPIIFWNLR